MSRHFRHITVAVLVALAAMTPGCHDDNTVTGPPDTDPVHIAGAWSGVVRQQATGGFCPSIETPVQIAIAQSGNAVQFVLPLGDGCGGRRGDATFEGIVDGNQIYGTLRQETTTEGCFFSGRLDGQVGASVRLDGSFGTACDFGPHKPRFTISIEVERLQAPRPD
jgi:hypothetical protein